MKDGGTNKAVLRGGRGSWRENEASSQMGEKPQPTRHPLPSGAPVSQGPEDVCLTLWSLLTCLSALSGSCWAPKLGVPLPLFFPSGEALAAAGEGTGGIQSELVHSWPRALHVPTFLR